MLAMEQIFKHFEIVGFKKLNQVDDRYASLMKNG